LEIRDSKGEVVRTLSGNGTPPESVTWGGEDEDGRLVDDGNYQAYVSILDDMGQIWDSESSVSVLGFRDRTRTPIRVEISGDASAGKEGKDR
jgi:flagellar hook assembly protein FlgD